MSSIDVSTQCNFFLMNKPNVKRKSVACNIIKPQEKPKELLKNQAKPKTKTTQCFLMPFNLNIKVKTFDKFTNTIDPPKNLEIATKQLVHKLVCKIGHHYLSKFQKQLIISFLPRFLGTAGLN